MLNTRPQSNVLWQPQDVDFIFRSYRIFEKKLADILYIIPFSKENETTWSPELVNLFLDVGSFIDSVARNIVGDGKDKNDVVQIKNNGGSLTSKKVGELDIKDFEVNLFSNLKLPDSKVIVYVYPLQIIKPYKDYRLTNGWWNTYNLLKHNRIKNYSKANLIAALNSLAGLFLLLVRQKEEEFTKALVRFGWLRTATVPEFVHSERMRSPGLFWHDSELLGTHEVPEDIPDDINLINPALASQKFQKFFGRFNP